MPKEIIDTGRTSDNPSYVQVGWHDGTVQLSTQAVPLTILPPDGPPKPEGMFVDLNRRQINDLIRHLRKARDSAYGRDE